MYMNCTGPYGNLSPFVRGKTSSLPTQSKLIQIFCQYIKETRRNYRKRCFKSKSSPAHTHTNISSTLQLLSPPYTELASCLHQLQVVQRKIKDSEALLSTQESSDKENTALKDKQCLFTEQHMQRMSLFAGECNLRGERLEGARWRQANQKRRGDGFSCHEGKTLKFY